MFYVAKNSILMISGKGVLLSLLLLLLVLQLKCPDLIMI